MPLQSPPAPRALSWQRQLLHNLLTIRPLPQGRLGFSLRAGICVAAPVLVGWLLGDIKAGMLAALGGLTGLYGSGRPYASRALMLALVAASFALAVGFGDWIGHAWPLLVVPVVALIAMLATWLCNGLRVGPPGAYLFMLACASGSAMPVSDLGPWQVGLLVAAGGALAWSVHMLGALVDVRGPERAAVQAAGRAMEQWLAGTDAGADSQARQMAALALYAAWQALVNMQPRRSAAHGELARLRALNRQWHQLFADALSGRVQWASARTQAAQLQQRLHDRRWQPTGDGHAQWPLGGPGIGVTLAESLRAGSPSRLVIVRVGIAALVAGSIAAWFDLERAYWAVAAAVLMLHAGMDWMRTLQRSIERLLGTWAGLLLTAALLWWQPQGLWLVAVIFCLQFTVEMLVVRNYLLAALFITATGMTLAAGGHVQSDPAGFLLARGVDTLLGCVVALVVFQLLPARHAQRQVDQELTALLHALVGLNSHLAWAELGSPRARQLRASVSHRRFALAQAWEQAQQTDPAARADADQRWASLAAVQELTYRMLAMAWQLEREPVEQARQHARMAYGADGVARVQAALLQLQPGQSMASQQALPPMLPAFVAGPLQRAWEGMQGASQASAPGAIRP
jgi:uncharacterized membrane protein YccC